MAFGSITTSIVTTRTSVETFTPVAGVVMASAASVAHVVSRVSWESGNTGIATVNVYTSLQSGAFSADTVWDGIPLYTFSVSSNTNPTQFGFSISGVNAWRASIFNSSNSTVQLSIGYRID
jgi:hypothetical protein